MSLCGVIALRSALARETASYYSKDQPPAAQSLVHSSLEQAQRTPGFSQAPPGRDVGAEKRTIQFAGIDLRLKANSWAEQCRAIRATLPVSVPGCKEVTCAVSRPISVINTHLYVDIFLLLLTTSVRNHPLKQSSDQSLPRYFPKIPIRSVRQAGRCG